MRFTETKLECEVKFFIDDDPRSHSPKFSGVVHLCEVEYDANTSFWFGVVQVSCTYWDIQNVQQLGKGSDFCVAVFLGDGRVGWARLLNSEFHQDTASEHMRIALTGWTALSRQSEQ